ncbi:hypothetical protein [Sporomusa malonica]|uniref:Uncharacterized protein n=1 Tax=Sporomusa malonica TaxID=112901 RepID=A0A1W2DFJ2_9FIRM|nr:hypothetical protein [Sporomusa malonica]SMC96277.1 hypothetical protein SAMN04488500_115101 [Sporomusa malonica]
MPTLKEWKKKYVDKTGENAILAQDYQLVFDENHGFVMWKNNGTYFDIDHVCTDQLEAWLIKLAPLARSLHCATFRALTKRNPAAFMRLTKCKVNPALSMTRRNGTFYWAIEKNVADFTSG